MKNSNRINSRLAVLVALYFVATVAYHHCMHQYYVSEMPHKDQYRRHGSLSIDKMTTTTTIMKTSKIVVPQLTGLSVTTLVSNPVRHGIYIILSCQSVWYLIHASDPERHHSTVMLVGTVAIWASRLFFLQPLYMTATTAAPSSSSSQQQQQWLDFAMLLLSIGVFIPILLLLVGPDAVLLDDEDLQEMEEHSRLEIQRYLEDHDEDQHELDYLLDPAFRIDEKEEKTRRTPQWSEEVRFMMSQLQEILAVADDELEDETEEQEGKKYL